MGGSTSLGPAKVFSWAVSHATDLIIKKVCWWDGKEIWKRGRGRETLGIENRKRGKEKREALWEHMGGSG